MEIIGPLREDPTGRRETDSKPGVSRQYYWVATEEGHESAALTAEQVVSQVGVPETVLLQFWDAEINDEAAIKALPFALLLIATYAMMSMSHSKAFTIRGVEQAIDFDIEENANFAFTSPGNMGHKAFEDVNSFADFWSWMRVGFVPLYGYELKPVSEASGLDLGMKPLEERKSFLWHNRKMGPVRLIREIAEPLPCLNPELQAHLGIKCDRSPSGTSWELDPTELMVSQTYIVEKPGETVWLDNTMDQLKELETARWLDPDVVRVKVSFVIYNALADVVSQTNVQFMFPRTGHIWKEITHRSFILDPYLDIQIIVWELLFYGQVTWMFIVEFTDICSTFRANHCNPVKTFMAYFSFWNLVDWICISTAYAVLVLWMRSVMWRWSVTDSILELGESSAVFTNPTIKQDYATFFEDVEAFGSAERMNRGVASMFPLIILLRLFKAFSAQPRLALVTNTLAAAANDLFHFGIVLVSVFLTYALMGTLFFGHEDLAFATMDRSIMTSFCMLMGDFDVNEMMVTGRLYPTMVYFMSFMIMMVLIVLNMLVAILMDAYAVVKAAAANSETLFGQIQELMVRSYRQRRGLRIPMKHIVQCYVDANGQGAWESDKLVTVKSLMDVVPGLTEMQAKRDLRGAAGDYAAENTRDVSMEEVLSTCAQVRSIVENSEQKLKYLQTDFYANLLRLPDDLFG